MGVCSCMCPLGFTFSILLKLNLFSERALLLDQTIRGTIFVSWPKPETNKGLSSYNLELATWTLSLPVLYACFGAEGAKKDSTRSIHSIQAATEEASLYSTSFLDPGCYKGGCSLLEPLTRSRQPQMKQQIDLFAPPTRSIYSTKEDEASTRPIDHSEHRHKGANFAAPSLRDPQDRVFAQTASSLLSSSLYPSGFAWPLCDYRLLMWRFDHRRPASKRRSNGCLTYEFQRFVDSTKGLACLPIDFG
ncbi:putative protein [Arabidopsis thaliana]|uniref:Uncharacterized protein T18D12_130 n=1 Tax=Arabidopsis thaliana TaxID=3702 RepID=Q9M234_ARATH|nr:putative protein [Arabidopsis thaliana]